MATGVDTHTHTHLAKKAIGVGWWSGDRTKGQGWDEIRVRQEMDADMEGEMGSTDICMDPGGGRILGINIRWWKNTWH